MRAFAKRYLMFEIPIYFDTWKLPVHPWLMPIGFRCYLKFSAEVQSNEWADLFRGKTFEELFYILNMAFAVYRNSRRWQDIIDSQSLSSSIIRGILDPGALNLWTHVAMPGYAAFQQARARDPSFDLYCRAVQEPSEDQMRHLLTRAPLYGPISFGFSSVTQDLGLTLGEG